jgi:hypothetical protein
VVPPEVSGRVGYVRFCSMSHAGFFNAKKRSENSKQSKRKADQMELDRMDRIAEEVWQRILSAWPPVR